MNKEKASIIVPLMLGTFMAALDNSIVNVSLPVMQKQFGVGLDLIQWVITAYMLAFCVFMPLTNWLKDKIGLYKMYLISICIFLAGSLLSGLSTGLVTLIPSRIVQAMGGGALTPVALAMLSDAFHEKERGSVMGWWGLGVVVGPALGPTLGGFLTQYFGWPYIFFVNLPFGALALFLSVKYLKGVGKNSGKAPAFDLSGYIFFTIFIVLFQYSVARIEMVGFSSAQLYITFAISFLCLFGFIKTDLKKEFPVLDLSVFKEKEFVAAILVTAIRSVGLFGGLFLLPFLLQGLMGYTELQTGLLLLPAPIAIAILMPIAGKWADRNGPGNISILGVILLAVSTFEIAFLGIDSGTIAIIIPMVVRGIGLGLLFSPVSAAVINAVPARLSATASSYYSLFMQIGGSIGISILAVLHQFLLKYYDHEGKASVVAEQQSLKTVFIVAGVILLMAVWPAFTLRREAE